MKNTYLKLFITLLIFSFSNTSTFSQKQPNVIIIMTDDQGYGEFSCHGNPITQTPNIDKLASAGVRLDNFHVAPMCTPTRGQLMSGVDAFRNNAINVSSGRTLLRSDLKTMADLFKAAGYRTGLFGKWHLGDNYPFRPQDRGFDETLWFPSSHINSIPDYWNNDYFDDTYIHNGKRKPYKGYCTDVFFDEAISWMKSKSSKKPFFVYLAPNAAHSPHFVPEKYREPIRKALAAKPELVSHLNEEQKDELVSFLAMGGNIDENMGKLDDNLAISGLLDNTIVVFLTDNGSTMGFNYYNAGMKGNKTTLWEGGHRVPCFIRWKNGNLPNANPIKDVCQVQDLMPTLLDFSGIKIPKNLDGISLADRIKDRAKQLADRMMVINYSRMPGMKVNYSNDPTTPNKDGAAVLWGDWRLLENRELYNVGTDPHQDKDVSAEFPDMMQKMRNHLDNWWNGVKDHVSDVQRVIIGSEKENPMLLTACEWLDVFVDQQKQVRQGDIKNGSWHLEVAQAGQYEFKISRWASESGLKLDEGYKETKVTDGILMAGKSLPIKTATLKIGDKILKASPSADNTNFEFTTTLKNGLTELRTAFLDENGKEICGAYYVYVRRI
jgi:arylsulfatase A-like enzyme